MGIDNPCVQVNAVIEVAATAAVNESLMIVGDFKIANVVGT